jgi:hypothetical protein
MNKRKCLMIFAAVSVVCLNQARLSAQGSLTPSSAPAPLFKSLDQVESRTPIGISTVISTPGSYFLTGNIAVTSGNGITITANDVQLDLRGFTISSTANPASGIGIALSGGVTNVIISDGFIYSPVTNNGISTYGGSGFSSGIYFVTAASVNSLVKDVSVSGCTVNGIGLSSNVGANTGDTVERCEVMDCGGAGIIADRVTDSIANVGTATAIFCSVGVRDRGISYSAIGMDAAASAQDCYGQSTGFYGVNAAMVANNCFGSSTNAYGIYSFAANNCYAVTSIGTAGLYAGVSANNCYGFHSGSGGGTGLAVVQIAHGCVGINSSSGNGYGITSGSVISGCVGSGVTNTLATFKYNTP